MKITVRHGISTEAIMQIHKMKRHWGSCDTNLQFMIGNRHIILASASPRRLRLLTAAGWQVQAMPADINETIGADEIPEQAARRLALAKAKKIAGHHPRTPVIGADTMVILDGKILGKPGHLGEAREMLRFLAGRTHTVITGVALLRPSKEDNGNGSINLWSTRSQVQFRPLTEKQIEHYLTLINPLDKAGGYAIQKHGDIVIEKIEGLRSNVMGLPIEEVESFLVLT